MMAVLGLIAYTSGVVLVCFAVYGALLWLSRTSLVAFYLLGTLGLLPHLLVLFITGLVCFSSLFFYSRSPLIDWSLLGVALTIFLTWGASMIGGTIVVRRETQGQLTRLGAFLFCAVYLVASLFVTVAVSMPFGRVLEWWLLAVGHLLGDFAWPNGLWGLLLTYFTTLLMWLFPLGVPLSLLMVANFRRLSRAATSGSFA